MKEDKGIDKPGKKPGEKWITGDKGWARSGQIRLGLGTNPALVPKRLPGRAGHEGIGVLIDDPFADGTNGGRHLTATVTLCASLPLKRHVSVWPTFATSRPGRNRGHSELD